MDSSGRGAPLRSAGVSPPPPPPPFAWANPSSCGNRGGGGRWQWARSRRGVSGGGGVSGVTQGEVYIYYIYIQYKIPSFVKVVIGAQGREGSDV